jgi:hypothetical protein
MNSHTDLSEATGAMSPEEELAFIRKMMTDSRQSMVEDGKPYIAWGLLVALAMGVTYVSALVSEDFYTAWIWMGMVVLGMLYTLFEVRQSRRRNVAEVNTFAGRLQGAIWGACGTALGLSIMMIMWGYSSTQPSIPPLFTCSISALILGIAYYLSGFVLQLKWLRNLSIAWWLGAIVMFFLRSVHVLGIYAGMLLLFQVVPGIILNRKYREATRMNGSAPSVSPSRVSA